MTLWLALTHFGDSALLLPLILWMAFFLLIRTSTRRDGWRWIAIASIGGGFITISKLMFMAWDLGIRSLNFTGFSGHVALSFMFWPSLVALLPRSNWRRLAQVAAVLLCIGISMSRFLLKAHSGSEIIFGFILGSILSLIFIRGLRPLPHAHSINSLFIGGTLIIFLLCYGLVFPSQHLLNDLALWMNGRGHVYMRHTILK